MRHTTGTRCQIVNVNQVDDPRWPYLSPSSDGWAWVSGPRGHLRRLLIGAAPTLDPHQDRTRTVLEMLQSFDEFARAIEEDILLLVVEAHNRGASWADIGKRLGRSKQSVYERFQGRIHDPRTRQFLLRDLDQAERRARYTFLHGPVGEERQRAQAFLHQHANHSRAQ